MKKIGILLTNTGTPEHPTPKAVRRYLKEFLSDKRVVKIPRFIWLPILYFVILPFRARQSAELYRNIWTEQGSPMRYLKQRLSAKLQQHLTSNMPGIYIESGMNYGTPSIKEALHKLQKENIDELVVLPLYPQYSNTTTASSFDQVASILQKWPALPHVKLIRDYADQPAYIQTLAASVKAFWQAEGQHEHLLISFHGLPERFTNAGDPYKNQCEQTASLLAAALQLTQDQWTLCYQSKFGYDKWLQPSTQTLLDTLPAQGIKQIDVICPGFSIDCLETLEEIAKRGKEDFLAAGGTSLRLIPALNDSQSHIDMLSEILSEHIDF